MKAATLKGQFCRINFKNNLLTWCRLNLGNTFGSAKYNIPRGGVSTLSK